MEGGAHKSWMNLDMCCHPLYFRADGSSKVQRMLPLPHAKVSGCFPVFVKAQLNPCR